jgi:hypothetical protein
VTVRGFNGGLGVGVNVSAGALATNDGGPITLAFLWKPAALSNQGLVNARESGALKWAINPFSDGLLYYSASGFASSNTIGWGAASGWLLTAITKASGSATPRWHQYSYTSTTWTHVNATNNVSDSTISVAIDNIGLGYLDNDEVLNGNLAVIGAWNAVLSDGDLETMPCALSAWVDLTPAALWPFNQASTSDPVLDVTGNGADQTSITGTSVVNGDDPPCFSFSLTSDVVVVDTPGAFRAGGSDVTVLATADVTVTDQPRAMRPGGSPATVVLLTGTVVHDSMVMPVLTNLQTCLQQELAKVSDPPDHFHLRPGASFSPLVAAPNGEVTSDECCEGIAWARLVTMYPTDDFPTPMNNASNIDPAYWAVQVETGVDRCIPFVSAADQDAVPTQAEWLAATQAQLDDLAALRRAACCLAELYGKDSVIYGNGTPLENESTCGGVTLAITVRVPACDCQDVGP